MTHSIALSKGHRRSIVLLLGSLIALTPLNLDMYLPAFPAIAHDLHTTTAALALTLSSDFIGIALGQLCYGPLLDRFGRKRPLYVGLFIYMIACFGCIMSRNLEQMVFWRFMSGVGGCVAGVAASAVVRDCFPLEERPKIFSLMMLVMGVSPLFAPSLGNILTLFVGWQVLFFILALIALFLMLGTRQLLPSVFIPDREVRLSPWRILSDYKKTALSPHFYLYGLCGASSFGALFAYVSGSPFLFVHFFHTSTTTYSLIFTMIAAGFILASQLNIFLLKRFSTHAILSRALFLQAAIALLFLMVFLVDRLSLLMASGLLFFLMASISVVFSNSSVLAMAPFGTNAGRASAFIGFTQMFCGAISSMSVGTLGGRFLVVMPLVIMITSLLALSLFTAGEKNVEQQESL